MLYEPFNNPTGNFKKRSKPIEVQGEGSLGLSPACCLSHSHLSPSTCRSTRCSYSHTLWTSVSTAHSGMHFHLCWQPATVITASVYWVLIWWQVHELFYLFIIMTCKMEIFVSYTEMKAELEKLNTLPINLGNKSSEACHDQAYA